MTFDDDFVILRFDHGDVRASCASLGISWPPPESLNVAGFTLNRERYSSLTDEQRAKMTNVCRGAEYVAATPAGEAG